MSKEAYKKARKAADDYIKILEEAAVRIVKDNFCNKKRVKNIFEKKKKKTIESLRIWAITILISFMLRVYQFVTGTIHTVSKMRISATVHTRGRRLVPYSP